MAEPRANVASTGRPAATIAGVLALLGFWGYEGAMANAKVQCGTASWYAHTGLTASGEKADPSRFGAAHRTLPFGTWVVVENLRNGRVVVVRINDRGPFIKGRIVDVTRAAAERLGFLARGTTRVRVRELDGEAVNEAAECR